jgi:hypothetical protein
MTFQNAMVQPCAKRRALLYVLSSRSVAPGAFLEVSDPWGQFLPGYQSYSTGTKFGTAVYNQLYVHVY